VTKRELINFLQPFDDDTVLCCHDSNHHRVPIEKFDYIRADTDDVASGYAYLVAVPIDLEKKFT
jgi:hypothetical protein